MNSKVLADKWNITTELPWNKLRYEITNQFIKAQLNFPIRSILNIGCGNGIESFLFNYPEAELTFTDISTQMLNNTKEYAKNFIVSNKLVFIESNIESLDFPSDKHFDLILYHNVLEYINSPVKSLLKIMNWLSPDSILSIRHLNKYSNLYAPAIFENDLDLSTEYLNNSQFNSSFDRKINTYSGEEIKSMLEQVGLKVLKRYGVISLCGLIANNEVKSEPVFYQKLKDIEIQMATTFPYFHTARFGLFLCKKG
ncbi:MAG: class I SAM-dependent methyltransferase [Actinomycetia bacterium]|nr:class I SAM-dependent methyltransferase [Actinomycetes bacterium]